MTVGRSVFSGVRCLLRWLKKSEWVSYHGKKENGRINCHAPLWSMKEIILPFIDIQVNKKLGVVETVIVWEALFVIFRRRFQCSHLFPFKMLLSQYCVFYWGWGIIERFSWEILVWKTRWRVDLAREHSMDDDNDVWLSS